MPASTNTAEEVLVIGHRNPDTDAICSALAYADFYSRSNGTTAVACYLDELGPETVWLLTHLGLNPPRQISDVYWRVADVMRTDTPTITANTTIREAGLIMRAQELGSLPVLDDQGKLLGVMPRDLLADRYLGLLQLTMRTRRSAAVIQRSLEAEQLSGPENGEMHGYILVGTFSPATANSRVTTGDIVVIEDDEALQSAVINAGAGCLIIAGNAPVSESIIEAAQMHGVIMLRTAYGALAIAALIEQSGYVSRVLDRDQVAVKPNDLLNDAQQHLRNSRLASLPVVDQHGMYRGLLLRRVLVPQDRRRVILIDHNHASQAAPGVGESAVIAIVDHHNLGGLRTLQPLTMQIEPVGCTCTLIAENYQRAGLKPPVALAGAMLGAILSDTVQFRSPTTTPRDRAAADWLAELSGEEIDTLAHNLFRARLPNPLPPPAWWVGRDWKTYTFGNTNIGIAQVELVDVEAVIPPIDELRTALAQQAERTGLASAFLMLTDILDEASTLIAANSFGEQIASRAFEREIHENRLLLPGVMSRKQQVVPQLAAALTR